MIEFTPSVVGAMQPAATQAPVNAAVNAAVAVANANSAISVPGNIDVIPMVPAMTQTIVSNTGGSAAAITAYFLNEATYNNTPTNNGSGASSVSNSYGDGFSGKSYSALSSNGGIKCYGFTLNYVTTATGAQDSAGLSLANPTLLIANFVGANQIPKSFVLGAGQRNTQYQVGQMTVLTQFTMYNTHQFSYAVPVGGTVTLIVLTQPQNQ